MLCNSERIPLPNASLFCLGGFILVRSSEFRVLSSEFSPRRNYMNLSGLLIMVHIILPTSVLRDIKSEYFSGARYLQSFEKFNQTSVSVFSVSESESFERKCALYFLFRYASARLAHTDRDALRI